LLEKLHIALNIKKLGLSIPSPNSEKGQKRGASEKLTD
jgi:hypothetical protein